MNQTKPIRTLPRQYGVGLIEVMIGLTAGLILLGLLVYFFLGSRQLNRTHDDVSRMQESGRIAMEILGKAIRQAGARTDVTVAFGGAALAGTEAPDTITVRYDVQDGGEVDGGEADCLGNKIPIGPITYVFAVDTATKSLTCTNGTGAAPAVVMDNIENMQITYGIDSNRDGIIESYQSASGPPALIPNQVSAVRMSLLVRGPTLKVATNAQTYTYNGASVTSTDGYLRQVYSSTFTVRNQAK